MLTWSADADDVPDGLPQDEHEALVEERLAVAILPVTVSQYAAYVTRHRHFDGWTGAGDDVPRLLSPSDAWQYLEWLRAVCAADYRIVSEDLWRYLARRGGACNADIVSLETYPGLKEPLPVDTQTQPGRGRCDRFSLFDLIGNTREYVLKDAHGGLSAIGGNFDESILRARDLRLRPVDQAQNTFLNGLRLIRLFPRRGDGS